MLLQILGFKMFNTLKPLPCALICNVALSPQTSVCLFDLVLEIKALWVIGPLAQEMPR